MFIDTKLRCNVNNGLKCSYLALIFDSTKPQARNTLVYMHKYVTDEIEHNKLEPGGREREGNERNTRDIVGFMTEEMQEKKFIMEGLPFI